MAYHVPKPLIMLSVPSLENEDLVWYTKSLLSLSQLVNSVLPTLLSGPSCLRFCHCSGGHGGNGLRAWSANLDSLGENTRFSRLWTNY